MTDDASLVWSRVGRGQEYRGEARANLVRVAGIAAFYAVELATYRGLSVGPLELEAVRDPSAHRAVTAVAAAWTTLALGVQLCLTRRFFPRALPYVSTGLDLALLTMLLCVVNGPRSPLVAAYFLVLCLATLRLSLPLVWFTTAGALASYLVVLGFARYYAPTPERDLPRYAQVLFGTSVLLCGAVQGQIVRQVRSLAADFAARLVERAGGASS